MSLPAPERFDARGGPLLRVGGEVFVGSWATLGWRGQAAEIEWIPPGGEAGWNYRRVRLYAASVVSRILGGHGTTRPYLLGGVGVFKSGADATEPATIYPRKGAFYPVGFGVDLALDPRWTLGIETCLSFLEDRESRRITPWTDLTLNLGFALD